MKLKNLHLVHFRGAKDLKVTFNPTLTIIVGINGGGKTTILDSITLMLSWIVSRIKHQTGTGRSINENDITNNKQFSWIELSSDEFSSFRLAKIRTGRSIKKDDSNNLFAKSDFSSLNDYVSKLRDSITESEGKCNIPIFAFYPVNRSVIDIPLKIRDKHSFDLLSVYNDSLTSGANFRIFFEWYREREDIENENRKYKDMEGDGLLELLGAEYPDHQLEAVRLALSKFLPNYKNLSVRRKPNLRMELEKDGEKLVVNQLSDGEKGFIALIGDLARKLSIANPQRDNPLEGEGVVLIDEIDLHLHPQWQKIIVPKLLEVFPNLQFIITTHSPSVLSDISATQVKGLVKNYDIELFPPKQSKGLDVNGITKEIFNTEIIDGDTNSKLREIFNLIDSDQLGDAKLKINKLKSELNGDIPAIIRAEALITMLNDDDRGEEK